MGPGVRVMLGDCVYIHTKRMVCGVHVCLR